MLAYAETRLHPFPLIFIELFVGLFKPGIAVRSLQGERFSSLVPAGALIPTRICLPLFGLHQKLFGKPLGSVRRWKIKPLIGAVIFESIVISIIVSVFYKADVYVLELCTLLSVGICFLMMGFARDYALAVLGTFFILAAIAGLLLMPFPLRTFRLIDRLLDGWVRWRMSMIQALGTSEYKPETTAVMSSNA